MESKSHIQSSSLRKGRIPSRTKKTKPLVSSRAAPPIKDDFEEDALEEAGIYSTERKYIQQKEAVKLENKERKQRGEKPLRLPSKPTREPSAKRRAREVDSASDSSSFEDGLDVERRALHFEGQVILDCEPLKILSKYAPSDDAVFDALGLGNGLKPASQLVKSEPDATIKKEQLLLNRNPATLVDEDEEEVYPEYQSISAPLNGLAPTMKETEEDDEEVYPEYQDLDREMSDSPHQLPVQTQEPPSSFDDLEEEEPYPEYELAAGENFPPVQKSNRGLGRSESSVVTERPSFATTLEQKGIGPFALDTDDPTMAVPATINRFLRDYQRKGVEFFYNNYRRGVGGILGDDMGLGKTVQVISFLAAIMRKTGTSKDEGRRKEINRRDMERCLAPQSWPTALIVCPTSLVGNWSRELDTWGFFEYEVCSPKDWSSTKLYMESGYLDLVLISSELCIRYADDLKSMPFSVVIVDEAHRMKNPSGHLALSVKKLRCRAAFALTGTLMQNRMGEMWSVMDFVRRGWAGTLKEWMGHFVRPIAEGHRHDAAIKAHTLSLMRVGELHKKVLPHFYLRRDKGIISAELPRKRDLVVLCPLGDVQAQVYKRVIDSSDVQDFILRRNEPCDCGSEVVRQKCCFKTNDMGDDVQTAILRMFHALGRVANHLALLYRNKDDKPDVIATNARIFNFCMNEQYDPARHSSVEATHNPSFCGKWTVLKTFLLDWRSDPHQKNKVLLFSNSVRLLKMIAEFIELSSDLASSNVELLSGEVDKDERMAMVDRFQDPNSDNWLLLVSTLAGGVGLNLTAANKVVIFDPSWNPANDLQAMDRAFRIGQKRPVDVYRLVGKGTVEENMYERQIYKQQRARQVNGVMFERRIHSGFEGATTKDQQGELFGIHNLFQYNPEGNVTLNIGRAKEVELRIRQDRVVADFEADDDEDDGEESKEMHNMRRAKAFRMARFDTGDGQVLDDDALLNEVLSGGVAGPAKEGDSALRNLGITMLEHEAAFRDSPEERALYEIGLELQRTHPELLDIKANEAARYAPPRPAKRVKTESQQREAEVQDEPWQTRFAAGRSRNLGKVLVDLEDIDDE